MSDFKYLPDPSELATQELRAVYELMQHPSWPRLDQVLHAKSKGMVEEAMEASVRGEGGNLDRDAGAWLYVRELLGWFTECHDSFRNLIATGGK